MSKRMTEEDLNRLKKRGFKVIETTKTGKESFKGPNPGKFIVDEVGQFSMPELSEFSLDVPKRGRPNMSDPANVANPVKKNKFGAKKVVIDGIKFDSTKEGRRYEELKLLEKAGEISFLVLQKKYEFIHNGQMIGRYRADFVYTTKEGNRVVEDVKSAATRKKADYRLRRKMMIAFFGIEILET